ncbi:DoxX family protein [Pseudomonas sp. RL_35y_Pfl2_P42]|uniref:DoxX family protein n=1 Tax=Pseudomonas sp. RL_35y_Pfl2_P42 TaxID=3088710 RepID=UPI0030DC4ECA
MKIIKRCLFGSAVVVVAVVVGSAGLANLAGVPAIHDGFFKMGMPAWVGYFIGVCEIFGAFGLIIRPLRALSALGIAIIMLGAIYYHVTYTPLVQAVPAVFLAILCVYLSFRSRAELLKFGSVVQKGIRINDPTSGNSIEVKARRRAL